MSPKDIWNSSSYPFRKRFLGQGVRRSHSWDHICQATASFVIHRKIRVCKVSAYPVHSYRRGDGAASSAVSESTESRLACCFHTVLRCGIQRFKVNIGLFRVPFEGMKAVRFSYRLLAVILETPRERLRNQRYRNRFWDFETSVAVCVSSGTVKWSHFGDSVRIRLRQGNVHQVAGVAVRGR